MLDVYVHNLLSMKHFHGVSAGNPHECSLKLSIGKVRIKYLSIHKSRKYDYCRIDIEGWEDILKATKNIFLNSDPRYLKIFERLQNDEYLRNHMVSFMVRWGISASPCSILGHYRSSCFLGSIYSRIIAGPDPIRREELILSIFHLNDLFRRRIAKFIIRYGNGNCYCWNNNNGCTYSFVNLSTFA